MQLGGLYVKPRRNSRKAKHTKAYRTIEALLSICGLLVRAEQRILTVRYFYTLNIYHHKFLVLNIQHYLLLKYL